MPDASAGAHAPAPEVNAHPERRAQQHIVLQHNYFPASTGIFSHSVPEGAFRARYGLWRICLCPKVARIADRDVNKDQDKDKDLTPKDQDKDLTPKDQDKDKDLKYVLKDKDEDKDHS